MLLRSGHSGAALPLIAALFLMAEASTHCGAAEPVSTATLARAWQARTERIRTVRMAWKETRWIRRGSIDAGRFAGQSMDDATSDEFPSSDETLAYSCRAMIDGDKFRYEYEGPEWDVGSSAFVDCEHVGVWDGKAGKLFHGIKRLPAGSVGEYCVDQARPHVIPMRMAFRMMSPSWYDLKLDDYELSPRTEVYDGKECLNLQTSNSHLQQKVGSGRLAWRVRYLIDPAEDFSIVNVSRSKDDIPRPAEEYRISYTRDDSGIWYPSRWTLTLDSHDPPNTVIEGNVTEIAINKESDPSQFNYEFPNGTLVQDDRTNELYIARAGGAKRPITDAEQRRNTPYEDLLATEAGEAVPGQSAKHETRKWLAVVALAVLCGIVLYSVYRKRRLTSEYVP